MRVVKMLLLLFLLIMFPLCGVYMEANNIIAAPGWWAAYGVAMSQIINVVIAWLDTRTKEVKNV